jgi:hypothetical protein
MIKEFALEPEAITASYRDFCYFTEKFGVHQGRVIAEFPRKWQRMVCESAQRRHAGKVEFTKIVERLKTLKEQIVLNSGRPGGDGTKCWVDRAMDEHIRLPFAGIIAQANPAYPDLLIAADLDDADIRFHVTSQRHITRTAAEIVNCVRLLLKTSKTVKLVDPHFDPAKLRWRRMLALVLEALANNGQNVVHLEIHRADNAIHRNLQNLFDKHIPDMRPAGIAVRVYLHPENVMHNRFILTPTGGASFHTGLDDNEDGNSTSTDLVSFLSPEIRATEWTRYSTETPFLIYQS